MEKFFFLTPLATVCILLYRKRYIQKKMEVTALFVSFVGLTMALCANYDHIWLFVITGLLFSTLYPRRDRNDYNG